MRAWTLYQLGAMFLIKYGTMRQSHGRKPRIFQIRERRERREKGGGKEEEREGRERERERERD